MPVAPATIVRTNRSWPGTSTTLSAPARRKLERREAELDRDAALALLGQAVGVDAGQRLDQHRLAVVDVAGGAERERRRRVGVMSERDAAPRARRARRQARPRSSDIVRGSSSSAPSCTRAMIGGSPRAQALAAAPPAPAAGHDRDHRALQLQQRQRSAAGPARSLARSRRRAAPPALDRDRVVQPPARAASSLLGRGQHLAAPGSPPRALGIAVEAQRRLERGERELVDPQRARERMRAQALDRLAAGRRRARPAGRRAACRPRSRRRRRPRRRCARADGSSAHAALDGRRVPPPRRRALPSRGRRSPPARARVPSVAERFDRDLLGEADDAEVGAGAHASAPRSRAPIARS